MTDKKTEENIGWWLRMIELNKIYQGDCLELMKQIEDNSIDLVITSPPYDNLRIYNGYSFNFEGIAKELYRVTKDGGVVVWIVGDATIKGSETGTSFKQALYFKEIGFNFLRQHLQYSLLLIIDLILLFFYILDKFLIVFLLNKPPIFSTSWYWNKFFSTNLA